MGDRFYDLMHLLGRSAFWSNSSPVVIGVEHTHRTGAFLLAANHETPYDVPLIMLHSRRYVDFISIVEVFRNPLVAFFYGSLGAFPLDRSRRDASAMRVVLDRLERGRVVGIFPEGRLRPGANALVHTRQIRPGVGRIAKLANVPIVPCVLINSGVYSRFKSWLPHRRTRYGIIFGPPIEPGDDTAATEAKLVDILVDLHGQLAAAMSQSLRPASASDA